MIIYPELLQQRGQGRKIQLQGVFYMLVVLFLLASPFIIILGVMRHF